jgi:DNA-binding transcriptional LysR family regulator
MIIDRLAAMRAFLRIVECGSVSAVAREFGISQPTVSKQLAALETGLGVRLLNRSTRALSLTDEGARYYERCRDAVEAVEAADASVRPASPSGLLRVSCPIAFGRLQLAPRMTRLLEWHPKLRIELLLSDRFVDLVEEGADVSVRIGELSDSALIARRLGLARRVTVATPGYFERVGEPAVPEDLRSHNCLVYTQLATADEWRFTGVEGERKVRVSGNFRANVSDAVREAVLSGLGVSMSPVWLFADALRDGRVRATLRDWEPPPLPIQAVWPAVRLPSPKIRRFVEFLAEELRADTSTFA